MTFKHKLSRRLAQCYGTDGAAAARTIAGARGRRSAGILSGGFTLHPIVVPTSVMLMRPTRTPARALTYPLAVR